MSDSSAGGTIGASYWKDAQLPLPGEWCMAGVPIELHQSIRPIGSTGDQGSQLPDCFLHSGDPGLTWVHQYGGKAIHPVHITSSLVETNR